MSEAEGPAVWLVADDDHDDCALLRDAVAECELPVEVRFVHDGEELLEYLYLEGRHEDPVCAPWPALVLLDLNMPRRDGREALQEIKRQPSLRRVPVVALTTSQAQEDIVSVWELGGNAYLVKPATYSGLVELVRALAGFWLGAVARPDPGQRRRVAPTSHSSPGGYERLMTLPGEDPWPSVS